MQAPEAMTLKVIAHIHTAFPTKFGIPRQSGLVDSLRGEIVFTPEYRNPDALRGLEDFSHIWLVWQFSGAVREKLCSSATCRKVLMFRSSMGGSSQRIVTSRTVSTSPSTVKCTSSPPNSMPYTRSGSC